MIRAWVVLLLLGTAQAQVMSSDAKVGFPFGTLPFGQLDWAVPTAGGGFVAISAPLTTPGCFASPYTSGNLSVTVTRASTANSSDNSQSCAANEATVESDGLSSWHAATNYVSNPGTHPKTGESLAAITATANPMIVWGEGSGTITIAAGTATLSANTCATPVTLPAKCSITVSGTGSPTITTTGAMTHVQVEGSIAPNGSAQFPTPRITGGAAPLTRVSATHNITTAINALNLYQTNRWCASITAKPYRPWVVSGLTTLPWTFGNTSSGANSASLGTNGTALNFTINDSALLSNFVVWTMSGLADNSEHRITGCNANGTPILCVDGTQVGTATINGTGLWNANPATSMLGNNVASIRQWDGDLSNFKLCKGATKCSDCP